MNSQQLRRIGVPEYCLKTAVTAIQNAASAGQLRGAEIKSLIRAIVDAPASHVDDPYFGPLARLMLDAEQPVVSEPIEYRTWGSQIEPDAHRQMREACALPSSRAAALMPDAHVGYGLPIGGVLATEGSVVPYAVGVDIACRMKLSVLDMPASTVQSKFDLYRHALEKGTRFGVGAEHQKPQD